MFYTGFPSFCVQANDARCKEHIDFMKRIRVILPLLGWMAMIPVLRAQSSPPGPQGALTGGTLAVIASNINARPMGWKPSCFKPDCDPGGKGIPGQPPAQTFGVFAPSLSGSAMELSLTTETPASFGQTNVLWTWFAPESCDQCTHLMSHFEILPGQNSALVASYETDMFLFDSADGIDFMWGLQCNQKRRIWQIDNQYGPWVDTAIPCSLSNTRYHDIVFTGHRVTGDTSCNNGMPCEYFDTLSVDGTVYVINQTRPAAPLKSGWKNRIGMQFQIDSSGRGASNVNPLTTSLYVDESTFQASY